MTRANLIRQGHRAPAALRRVFALVLGLAVSACAAEARHQNEDAQISAIQKVQYETQALAALEPEILKRTRPAVSRHGDTLVIQPSAGAAVAFEDRTDCPDMEIFDENCRQFRLVADLPGQRCFLVAKLLYESINFLVVDDATGKQVTLPAAPRFQPGGQRMLVISNSDLGPGHFIQLWRRHGDDADLEWEHQHRSDPIGYTEFGRWRSDDRIELIVIGYDPASHELRWSAELRHDQQGWRIDVNWAGRY